MLLPTTYQQILINILTVCSVLTISFFLIYIERILFCRYIQKLENTPKIWDDALLFAAHQPLQVLICLWGITIAIQLLTLNMPSLLYSLAKMSGTGSAMILIWFLYRLAVRIEKNVIIRNGSMDLAIDLTTFLGIMQIVRVSIWCIAGLVVLKYFFHFQFTALWALGGVGSFILGWAAKDLLANYFGGLMIYLDRPFAIGEWIRSPDRNIEGIVEHIGWRLTSIRTFDLRLVFVPNSIFANISVENPSRMTHRRIKEVFHLRNEDAAKMNKIINEINNMLMEDEDIDKEKTCFVGLSSFSFSSLDIMIYCFTKTTEWIAFAQIKQNILFKALNIIHDSAAQLSSPNVTLHIPDEIAQNEIFNKVGQNPQ